jgi:hypothetical protein
MVGSPERGELAEPWRFKRVQQQQQQCNVMMQEDWKEERTTII